jgi:hypothetical protein
MSRSPHVERRPPRISEATLTLFVVFAGCATVGSGEYGQPLDAQNRVLPQQNRPIAFAASAPVATGSGLLISAGEKGELASKYFGAVEVTFENTSSEWVQIDRVDLDFGTPDANRSVLLPWGSDIDTWEEATLKRNAIRDANTRTALDILALGAGAAAVGHGGRRSAYLGGVLVASAVGTFTAQAPADTTQVGGNAARFPEDHLLSMPIRIPPGLFTKRWLLLYTAEYPLGGCVQSMILRYDVANHPRESVLLKFKDNGSEWQRASCLPKAP